MGSSSVCGSFMPATSSSGVVRSLGDRVSGVFAWGLAEAPLLYAARIKLTGERCVGIRAWDTEV